MKGSPCPLEMHRLKQSEDDTGVLSVLCISTSCCYTVWMTQTSGQTRKTDLKTNCLSLQVRVPLDEKHVTKQYTEQLSRL